MTPIGKGLLCFLVLFLVDSGETSENAQGTTQILSFSFEKWLPLKQQWESTTDIKKQDHIRLMCVVDDDLISGVIKIRKWNENTAIENVTYPSKRQVLYDIPSLECDSSGSYVCEGGNGMNRSLSLDIPECSPRILSFTFEKWDTKEEQWTASTDIERGKDIRLVCTVAGSSSDQFSLTKSDTPTALIPVEHPNNQQITHVFRDLQCEEAGEYVCGDEHGLSRPLEIDISGCSTDILSFTFEEWDPDQGIWKATTDIEKGEDIRLTCIISGPLSENFSIKNIDDTTVSLPSQHPNNRQIIYEMKSVDCDKLGAYICEDGRGTSRRTELGIFGCAPRFCGEEQASSDRSRSRALTFNVGEAGAFSVCVIAFPDISVVVTSPTGVQTTPRSDKARDTAGNNRWSVKVDPEADVFSAYVISVDKPRLSADDYGKHTVSISTTHKGQREELIYTVDITDPSAESPDCPTDLVATDVRAGGLNLTWQSRFGHSFAVFSSKDGEPWMQYGSNTQGSYLLITGLQADTNYSFRVVHVSEAGQELSGEECQNTLEVKTATFVDAGPKTGDYAIPIIIALSAVLLVVSVVLVVIVKRPYWQTAKSEEHTPKSQSLLSDSGDLSHVNNAVV